MNIKLILKNILENIDLNDLSSNWHNFDFESFSKDKKLYDFQIEALENFLKVLWFYYEKDFDYQEGENLEINDKRKEKLFKEYLDYDLNHKDVSLKYKEEKKHKFIFEYYPLENEEINFKHLVNRAGFWMATGSGKTLVIVKIIEFLRELIKRKEIPNFDILFLTHREDLINQFKKHIEEYNEGMEDKITVYDLKEYEELKRNLFCQNFVFYYRADLFSDEEKEKIVDFRNYYNDGKWFVILDEAHKGDTEESKRQHIFSILSKNGFLFNFSATFSDPIDLITTCFEYNLSTFIENGYGKKIYISDYEARVFKNKDDFRQKEKQKIILKGLILFTYIKKQLNKIREKILNAYHNPLLLVLVNSVNQEDADLKLFFEEIKNIVEGSFDKGLIEETKNELIKEFKEKEEFVIPENDKLKIDFNLLSEINYQDILKDVFNSGEEGKIEISYSPREKGEVAFKLKTSTSHFALIKTGAMPDWLESSLNKFEVNHKFENEKFFEEINSENSSINILLGSRVFYEGWDSNRPNIIMFINIGTQKDAKKFVLQSIGRGVRIEPIRNERKRLLYIKEKISKVFDEIKDYVYSIESLFIFGTNKNAIETIITEVNAIKEKTFSGVKISLFKNIEAIKKNLLLVPKYKEGEKRIFEEEIRYGISENDFEKLKEFNEFIRDDRVLLMLFNTEPKLIKYFRESLTKQMKLDSGNYYKKSDLERGDVMVILDNIFSFWGTRFKDFEKLEELKDEIKHFENIVIEEAKFNDFESIKEAVLKTQRSLPFENLRLEYISNHYYLPIVLSKDEKIDYIKHIIKTKSEVEFIEKLENYLAKQDNKFKEFDWWMFSKIDESLDEVYIPYYNLDRNSVSKFKPDFIFWLRKGNEYFIVFVDPKSTKFTDYENKISWYKKLFEENDKPKVFKYKNLKSYVYCFLYTDDEDKVRNFGYQKYWLENIEEMLKWVLSK
ncbi:MAG: helicase [Candidatus Parcubacteria bacterium]|nr:MAG: helicase [Candidatus Parcubacteria bacterium]